MQSTHEPLDLLLCGVSVLTADAARPVLRDARIGIRADRIALVEPDVGTPVAARRTLRLPGRVVTPGFVNVHTHSVLTMVRGVAFDLGFAPSYTAGIPKAVDLDADDACALARLGALEALLAGSTLIGDHFAHADVTTAAMAALGMRIAASWRIHDVDFDAVAGGSWEHHARIGRRTLEAALALAARWKGHPRVYPQLAPHAADTCSVDFLREVAAAARSEHLRVNTHLCQSSVEIERVRTASGMTPVEVLEHVGLLDARLMGGHCIYLNESDIARIARAGAHVVHIPKCNAASGRLAPVHAIKRAGINIALATDTQHGDMIEVMRWALATARIRDGKVDASWQPAHVFHMATLGGAIALGMEDEIGSIAVGKKADLAVLDFRRPHLTPRVDLTGTLVHAAQGRDVEMVLVDGEVLVEGGLPTRADMGEVCARAESAARRAWAKAGRSY